MAVWVKTETGRASEPMPTRDSVAVNEGVHTLFQSGALGAWTDGQLVARFVSRSDGSEAAFRALVHRHGPMVMGVCRRVLGDAHAAEDAFQATFLVLVKKAGSLRDHELLSSWLYGVAHRTARKARAAAARRRAVEQRAAEQPAGPDGEVDAGQAELRSVIDEEVRRLPERYRVPLVLCHLEGLHHHEVARRLGCPVGTVESRLSRARERLRCRLAHRGVAPTTAALAAALAPSAAPAALVEETLRAAALLRPGAVVGGVAAASASAANLVRRGRGHALTQKASVGVSGLVVCAAVIAAGLGAFRAGGAPARPRPDPDPTPDRAAEAPAPRAPRPIPQPTRSPSAIAAPVAGITVDGRLDDWPSHLPRYPIAHRLRGDLRYDLGLVRTDLDPGATFMAGYDREAGLIYLAVVVHDEDLVVSPNDPWHTDAVEVYVDGLLSREKIPEPSGDWKKGLDAATMPVLQYVAVPGSVAAYDDLWDANPSLVYGKIGDTATTMRHRREGNITTYEWAVQAFDRYPDWPTRLEPGKRLGLDIAVVDKDPQRPRPAWYCWGPPPRSFKGCDAGLLGELILGDAP
jgi:RNA polymerase sigma factor (sigma-70 family)